MLQTERPGQETDFLVDSAEEAVRRVEALGGSVLSGPEDIPVGRVAMVADPFGNPLVLLDLSKGTFQTGPDGTVTGVGLTRYGALAGDVVEVVHGVVDEVAGEGLHGEAGAVAAAAGALPLVAGHALEPARDGEAAWRSAAATSAGSCSP